MNLFLFALAYAVIGCAVTAGAYVISKISESIGSVSDLESFAGELECSGGGWTTLMVLLWPLVLVTGTWIMAGRALLASMEMVGKRVEEAIREWRRKE